MYKAFDGFLQRQTWHSKHAADEESFFEALNSVIHNPAFTTKGLARYIERQRGASDLGNDVFDDAKAHYVELASAMQSHIDAMGADYLKEANQRVTAPSVRVVNGKLIPRGSPTGLSKTLMIEEVRVVELGPKTAVASKILL